MGAKLGVKISIHAPTRGATARVPSGSAPRHNFNPRAHAGRDLRSPSIRSRRFYFNPRAHAGRDPVQGAVGQAPGYFNPRAHAGRDRQAVPISRRRSRFQSTRPRGARPYLPIRWPNWLIISIHAPTRGATVAVLTPAATLRHFNPRAHAGRDPPTTWNGQTIQYFNPRAHAGRDLPSGKTIATHVYISIHAPTRGAT